MTFTYNVGLQNVGSFQVSARPWLKDVTLTGVESRLYEFSNVTEFIYFCNDHNSSNHNLEIVFCEPKRAINFGGNTEYLETSFSAIDQLTVSAWIKIEGTIANQRLIEISGGNGVRVQTGSSADLRLRVGTTTENTVATVSTGEWINITAVINGTSNKLYLNGSFLVENSADAGTGFNGLSIGGLAAGYDGIYDELVLFSSDLNDSEVSELYNAGAAMKIKSHSKSSSLVSHWAFEDNEYKEFYSTPDATNLIYDRVSGNNLSLTNGVTPLVFEDGRLLENAFSRHKITLTGREQINLNIKVKQIFLRSTNNLELSICAGLTSIPSARMYELTGPGIDE